MKIIEEVPDPCPCAMRRTKYLAERQQSGYRDLGVNSILECDCGVRYVLIDSAGGRLWTDLAMNPMEVKDA